MASQNLSKTSGSTAPPPAGLPLKAARADAEPSAKLRKSKPGKKGPRQLFLNKRQVLSSKVICTKCKASLLKHKKRFFEISPGMFNRRLHFASLRPSASNSALSGGVFATPGPPVQVNFLCGPCRGGIKWNKAELCKKLGPLKNLNYVLIKLFAGKPVTASNLNFAGDLETRLLKMISSKKILGPSGALRGAPRVSAPLPRAPQPKRFEENLRYVANKAFRFLRKRFRERLFPVLEKALTRELQAKGEPARQAYTFFGYYFGRLCAASGKPVESFFHPNTRRICDLRREDKVPRTVSQQYLKSLQASAHFVRDFAFYLQRPIALDAEADIVKKTRKLCLAWETRLKAVGAEELVAHVRRQLWENPKFKLPWTLGEVKVAVDQMNKVLAQAALVKI